MNIFSNVAFILLALIAAMNNTEHWSGIVGDGCRNPDGYSELALTGCGSDSETVGSEIAGDFEP